MVLTIISSTSSNRIPILLLRSNSFLTLLPVKRDDLYGHCSCPDYRDRKRVHPGHRTGRGSLPSKNRGASACLGQGLLEKKLSIDDIKSLLAGSYRDDEFKTIFSYRQLVVHLDICTARNPRLRISNITLNQNYYAWIPSVFHQDFHSIYCVVAHLRLLYCQIRNLFRIIDGRRFGMSPDAIINRMICEA